MLPNVNCNIQAAERDKIYRAFDDGTIFIVHKISFAYNLACKVDLTNHEFRTFLFELFINGIEKILYRVYYKITRRGVKRNFETSSRKQH